MLRRESPFRALRHRDFRAFWLGACVSFIGGWVQIIASGLLVYELTGSKRALGVIGLASGLPTTALLLFGGVIADRFDKRRILLFTQSIYTLTAFTLGSLTVTGRIQITHIIVISLINGTVFALDGPTRGAMVRELVGGDDLATGIALQSAAFNIARVVGPAIGGLIYARFGAAWCFFVNSASFLAVLWPVARMRRPFVSTERQTESPLRGLMQGLSQLKSNPLLRRVVSLTAVTSIFAFSAYGTLMPAIAAERLGVIEKDGRYGLLFSAIGIGSLCGVLLVGEFASRRRRGRLLFAGAVGFAVALALLSWTHLFGVALPMLFMVGLCAVSELQTANTLTQTLAPAEYQGRAVALHMFAMAGLQPFGAALAGQIAQGWGVAVALRLGASVLAVWAVALLAMRPEMARME